MAKEIKGEINKIPTVELFERGHNACAGCGCALTMRMTLKAAGPNVIVTHSTGCMEVVSTPYPWTAWKVPWIHSVFENSAAVASGIESVMKFRKKDIPIIDFAGDGGTFDIGLQALSGMAERGHNVNFICYDNGAYMNTGIQRSGATPKYGATTTTPAGKKIHGKQELKKDMPFIMASHRCYVATANIGYPQDFIAKVKKAISMDGPAYIQVFSPCVLGWKFPSDKTIEMCKLAFETNVYPIYEIENGVLKFTKKPSNQKQVIEYLKVQGRFKHMNDKEIADVQAFVDSEMKRFEDLEKSGLKIF